MSRFPAFAGLAMPEYGRLMIRPTDGLLVGRLGEGATPVLELRPFGLLTPDPPVRRRVVNARVENLRRSPMWRKLLPAGRCVVAISGFFESRRREGLEVFHIGEAGDDVPPGVAEQRLHFLPSLLAGLWDDSGVAVITRPAEGVVAGIHARMPAVLRPAHVMDWVQGDEAAAAEILRQQPPPLAAYRVADDTFKRPPDDPRLLDARAVSGPRPVQGMLF